MKQILITIFLLAFQIITYGQDIYTSRQGSKFFPGHLDIVISIDSNNLRYELFNHWYYRSYTELRQMTIPLDNLEKYNLSNDSISIKILDKKIHLTDKRYNLNRKIRHRTLCISPTNMRKISFAYNVSSGYKNISHYELYKRDDLNLNEDDFKKKVIENLDGINGVRNHLQINGVRNH